MEGYFLPPPDNGESSDAHIESQPFAQIQDIGMLSKKAQLCPNKSIPNQDFHRLVQPALDSFPASLFTNIAQIETGRITDVRIPACLGIIRSARLAPESQRAVELFGSKFVHSAMDPVHWLSIMSLFHRYPEVIQKLHQNKPKARSNYLEEALKKIEATKNFNEAQGQEFLIHFIATHKDKLIVTKETTSGNISSVCLRDHPGWSIGAYDVFPKDTLYLEGPNGELNYISAATFSIEVDDPQKIQARIQAAEEDYKKEQEQKESLKKKDLPKNFQYYQLFPLDLDKTVTSTFEAALLKRQVMKDKYDATIQDLYSNDPLPILQSRIANDYKQGKRSFYIDIYQHGESDHFKFTKKLKPEALLQLCRNFPDADIKFGSIACFGGGLRQAAMKTKNPPDIFLQTKPSTPNIAAKQGGNSYTSSYHELFLLHYMIEKPSCTYGEAQAYADEQTQKYSKGNSECIIDGELFVEYDFDQQIEEVFI